MAVRFDTHVHLFEQRFGFAEKRRYAPSYDSLPEGLLAKMSEAGMTRAVVVQPSFLGTDNSYLLRVLAKYPGRFLGIAVVEPNIQPEELEALHRAGVVGIRLNCIGKEAPDFGVAPYAGLPERLAEAGMVLQVQAEGAQWCVLEKWLGECPAVVVIDHFGRTAPSDGSGGFQSLLRAAARSENLCVKFSAPYRLPAGAAAQCARALLDIAGPRRILWGSDWPATQFEGRHSYADTVDWLADWLPNSIDRELVLSRNPVNLFGIDASAASDQLAASPA